MAGARKMTRLEAYELSVFAGVLALLPLTTVAWPISGVVGAWALWILRKAEVRAAFADELHRAARAR